MSIFVRSPAEANLGPDVSRTRIQQLAAEQG